jgi:hypothetical protein
MINIYQHETHLKLINLAQVERETLAEILELLRLNFKQKIFAKMGYSHLTKYMVRELKYSESAAWRRWNALKLTEELPEAKELLNSGAINLSTINKLSTHMKSESIEKKREALSLIKNKTGEQAEQDLFKLSGRSTIKNEFIKRDSDNTQRLSITLSDKTLEKINQLKVLMKKTQTEDVLNFALDVAIKELSKNSNKKSKSNPMARVARGKLRQDVLKRDFHTCQHPDCDEKQHLNVDHIQSYAKGGQTTIENLQILCGTHNRLKGTQVNLFS